MGFDSVGLLMVGLDEGLLAVTAVIPTTHAGEARRHAVAMVVEAEVTVKSEVLIGLR